MGFEKYFLYPFFKPMRRSIFTCLAGLLISQCCADIQIRHAQNLHIEDLGDRIHIEVSNPWPGGTEVVYRYELLRGDAASSGDANTQSLTIPVNRVVTLSTTYLSPIVELGSLDQLVGVASFKHINSPEILEKVEKGELTQVGSESSKNIEVMISLGPEVVFTTTMGNLDYNIDPIVQKVGVIPAVTAAYMENSPLGRAEWIKFFGAFFDKLTEAGSIFDQIESRYLEKVSMVSKVTDKPTVFANAPWGGTWHIPGADSYTARIIEDAGGIYVFGDLEQSGATPMSFESVYARASDADYWINTSYMDSIADVLASDQRYARFPSIQNGNVFNDNKRRNAHGGNDKWERGLTHPDEILSDLIAIFHPEVLPEHELIYYQRLK
jgi:iron complex transport system substrate-binding protein